MPRIPPALAFLDAAVFLALTLPSLAMSSTASAAPEPLDVLPVTLDFIWTQPLVGGGIGISPGH
jgi:hypothetical protein